MSIVVRAASPVLAPFVAVLGYYQTGAIEGRELLLPTGCMHIGVNLAEDEVCWYDGDGFATVHARRGAVLWGASAGPVGVDLAGQRAVVGVLFRPGGAYPFFGPPASAIDEPAVELEALWGRDGALLRERLLEAHTPQAALSTLEAVLLARAASGLEPDRAIAYAAAALGRGARVAAVADRLGMTHGRFLRRFTERVGLTPKRFARVRRLQRLLAWTAMGAEADWARVAVECGYFDQAHMINEFRALTGMAPSAYRPRSPVYRNHVPLPG
jgi:AraC-like DNA-binding protein